METTKRFESIPCGRGVIDTETGLEWDRELGDGVSWQEAMDRAALQADGWRLPSIEEMITLIDFSRSNPASGFPGPCCDWFWSASTDAGNNYQAWLVDLNDGTVIACSKISRCHARLVRGPGRGSR